MHLLRLTVAAFQAMRITFTVAAEADVGASLDRSSVPSPHGATSMLGMLPITGTQLTVHRLFSLWASSRPDCLKLSVWLSTTGGLASQN